MAGWGKFHNFKPKACLICGAEFMPKSGVHKFCSEECKGKHKYIIGTVTTDSQYAAISGNWRRYYSRILQKRGRKEDGLTIEALLALHEVQQGLCAVSGLPLTCALERGSICYTNSSIDRIEAGGSYAPSNIQLVCRHVNSFRGILPMEDFITVCRAVVRRLDGG